MESKPKFKPIYRKLLPFICVLLILPISVLLFAQDESTFVSGKYHTGTIEKIITYPSGKYGVFCDVVIKDQNGKTFTGRPFNLEKGYTNICPSLAISRAMDLKANFRILPTRLTEVDFYFNQVAFYSEDFTKPASAPIDKEVSITERTGRVEAKGRIYKVTITESDLGNVCTALVGNNRGYLQADVEVLPLQIEPSTELKTREEIMRDERILNNEVAACDLLLLGLATKYEFEIDVLIDEPEAAPARGKIDGKLIMVR